MTKSKTIGGMGFRDLAMFNDSLLAKQAWRLLNNKTSLFYKVFKARFFPNSSLLEAADSRMGGAIWRVGSGEKINIWQQSWLPRKHPTILLICPLESFENHTVDSFIDPSTRTWNEQLLIKKIPLSRNMAEDTLYWPYSTSRNYTCKSEYRFLKEEDELQLNAQTPPICHKHADQDKWRFRGEIDFTSVKELLSWMIEEGKPLELLAYRAWTVWNQRNEVRLNLQASPLHQVAAQSAEMLAHYRANTEGSTPQAGFVKVNFNGAVFGGLNKSGVGVVIRDNNGDVLASCSEKLFQVIKAEEAEALAARKALMLAHELGFQNVILEAGLLVEDVKVYSNNFLRVLYSHVRRNGNSVAHSLVRHVISIPDLQVWMEDVPSDIVSFLHLDVTHLHNKST
ncbi:hypothetical protein ACB092_01G321700 [Castanea dentata]